MAVGHIDLGCQRPVVARRIREEREASMTEKRIRKLAEKLHTALLGPPKLSFEALPLSIQAGWISVARTAIAELTGDRRTKNVKAKACRIDKHGKVACK